MSILALLLFWSLDHPILGFLTFIPLGVTFAILTTTAGLIARPGLRIFAQRAMGIGFAGLAMLWFFNFFAGHFIRNPIVYHFGQRGEGLVVAMESTSSTHNEAPVLRHEVLIRPQAPGAALIQSSFLTSDFNIYPHSFSGGYSYPRTGTHFAVRYLPIYPRALVISTADESDYTRSLRAGSQAEAIQRLQLELSMDPSNAEKQRALAALLKEAYRSDRALSQ